MTGKSLARDNGSSAPKILHEVRSESGLTERERMLLDRVEQLEKRVAELEGKDKGSKEMEDRTKAAMDAPTPASECGRSSDFRSHEPLNRQRRPRPFIIRREPRRAAPFPRQSSVLELR